MGPTFACKHAYLDKQTGKNKVVLCDMAGTPDFSQYKSIVQCMCAYQPPCPEKQLCALAKGWDECWRLKRERAEKQRDAEKAAEEKPQKPKTKRTKKAE